MLSVGRSRNGKERRRLGFGGRGGMDKNEVSACDDSLVDPDVALSYIDEKLQDVLGHFQKDFEGGVSAENLGAKFGGYGSFLPTYQRSPLVLPQPRSPSKEANINASRSPCNMSLEGEHQTSSVVIRSSSSQNNLSAIVPPVDDSGRKGNCMSMCSERTSVQQYDSLSKPVNGSDQKTLKVRIKVGSDNLFAKNKAAIYSGLGLDVSPSSSSEDSPDLSDGLSTELRDMPDESPQTIIKIMACFSVPEGVLLSPLRGNYLELTEKVVPFIKKYKSSMFSKSAPGTCEVSTDMTPVRDMKSKMKRRKHDAKKGLCADVKNSGGINYISTISSSDIDKDISGQQGLLSDHFDRQLISNSRIVEGKEEFPGVPAEGYGRTLEYSKETEDMLVKANTSMPKTVRDKQELMEYMGSSKVGKSRDGNTRQKGKLKYKIMLEKPLEGEKMISYNDSHLDPRKENMAIVEKNLDIDNADSKGYKMVKDQTVGSVDNVISSDKTISYQQGGRGKLSKEKREQQGTQNSAAPLVEFSEDMLAVQSSEEVKEKKKVSHARADQLVKKIKTKSHRKLGSDLLKESCGEVIGGMMESGTGLLEVQHKEKMNFMYPENETGSKNIDKHQISENSFNEPMPLPSACNDAAPAPSAAVVIEEHWVCCDICQKWRLLPYGSNPDNLPKKWHCSLLNWLPGLNSCGISEEETTKALNSLYLAPASGLGTVSGGHHDVASSSIAREAGQHLTQRLDYTMPGNTTAGKKKHGSKNGSAVANNSNGANSAKKNQQSSMENNISHDANQYAFETNSLSKAGLGHGSKSMGLTVEKQMIKHKEKHKNLGCYSDGGGMEKSKRHSKLKSKRVIHQDDFRASKKINKEDSHYLVRDWNTESDVAGMVVPDMINVSSAKAMAKKHSNVSSCKEKFELKGESAYSKRFKDEDEAFLNGENKEHFSRSGVERSDKLDFSTKRRKVKEQQEIQHSVAGQQSSQHVVDSLIVAKEHFSKEKVLKEKKSKIPKSDSKVFRRDVKHKNGQAAGKSQQHPPREALDCTNSLKRDAAYVQASTAATSSSSKISGSWKNKVSFLEARGSPVESVSSSPLRNCNSEILYNKRNFVGKDEAGSSVLGSPKKCSDIEGDWESNCNGKSRNETAYLVQQVLESPRSGESGMLGSSEKALRDDLPTHEAEEVKVVGDYRNLLDQDSKFVGEAPERNYGQDIDKLNDHRCLDSLSLSKLGKISSSCSKEKHRSCRSNVDVGKFRISGSFSGNKDPYFMENGGTCLREASACTSENNSHPEILRAEDYNVVEKNKNDVLGKRDHNAKFSRLGRRDNSCSGFQESSVADGPSSDHDQPKDINSRAVAQEVKCGVSSHEEIKPFLYFQGDKQGTQNLGPQVDLSSAKERKSELYSTEEVNLYAPSMVKQSRKPNILNGVQYRSSRQPMPNPPDTSSPIRRDSHSAANNILKEARDLKHTANRLKSEGSELESTVLYFEAALKFLDVASLWEPLSFDSSKQGDAAQSMQMYSETAKLCEFCAHEYERYKEMAAASLAFKCVEVAYLKAAYYKYPGSSKDLYELQTSLQMVPPGESPSSSASDVDNLNNQSTLGKAALVKGVNSPQVAGNHVIGARNHPHLLRLLNYTNDLNCAFEATRKSQIAVAAAGINFQKDGRDGIASVKRVLDFNFHNVKGLLRLVRLSMESITR
ncbi:cysteine-tryptophan domain-containing zinc finger protein 3-like [Typha angustifolia]|uniref:cysteine-tryptophan domain-containing zinc finger protein 3-like n=1 Tax=Typha angustifolia TaxID=59011 RepID=UPI003C2C64AD